MRSKQKLYPKMTMGGPSQGYPTRLAARWALFFCLVLLANLTDASSPLFPPHATIVLLAGLPGDVESENDYRDQLETWLEIVRDSGRVQNLLVLCDDPGTVTLPAGLAATVQEADRTNFLGLAQGLTGDTNSVVVIAWGHGGRQGSTPVFHVRGPRLTPADFKALAGPLAQVESRWILMFRGSGAFARELAGERRQILSSECGTMFASDPMGMSLLVKLARAEPSLSFEGLSEQLGRATTAWYSDRTLARTEEPTLWPGSGKPRLLAAAAEDERPAPAEPQKTNEAPAKTEIAAAGPHPDKLPDAWKEITRVEPRKYPETDGVLLRRRLTYTLGSNPALVSERDEFIQVLTPEGKRFGDFDIAFFPLHEDISFLDCEVLPPDGKLVRLDPDAIRERREQSSGDYQVGRRKFFSLPGVVPGAVLHVRYRTECRKYPLPHVSLQIPLDQDVPTLDSTIEVIVPRESPFHFALEGIATADPAIKQSDYGTSYSWRLTNLPARDREALDAPEQRPRLLFSTFPDWADFAAWYARITKLTDEITPEIAAKAAELTREAKSDRAKVLAIYNYVTGLRYVAVPLGVNSFRPHSAANVLRDQFGDCKDKANLFNALLHTLNISASLVLVPRFSQAYDLLPGLSFNHAISRVTLGGETIWADTTDDICRFGLLPPGDPGRKVLVIDGQTTALSQLPAPEPAQHQLTLLGKLDYPSPAGGVPLSLDAVAVGYPDYALRATARETREHQRAVPLLAARFRPVAGSFALEKQTATPVSALEEKFAWHGTGMWLGGSSTVDRRQLLNAPFWLPKEWDLALHRRKAALFLNQGYPLTLVEEFELALPPQAQPVALPGVSENNLPPLRWRIQWNNAGSNKLMARFRAELVRGELTMADTAMLQKQLPALLAALASGACLTTPR